MTLFLLHFSLYGSTPIRGDRKKDFKEVVGPGVVKTPQFIGKSTVGMELPS